MFKNISTYVYILACLLLFTSNSFPERQDTTKILNFDTAFNNEIGDQVLAKVGNKKITVREFLCGYEFGPAFYKKEKDSKSLYLKYLIDEKLLALDGHKQGYADSARVKDLSNALKADLTTTELFKEDIEKDVSIPKAKIHEAVQEKQITYDIKWLYAPNKDSLAFFQDGLRDHIEFDVLYKMQLNDSVFYDQRSMKMDRFKLSIRNPQLFNIIDTLKVNEVSPPIKAPDGWYIFMITDKWKNEVITQSMRDKDEYDAKQALEMQQMDSLSDVYVHTMLLKHNPVIQARPFDFLRSYIGNYETSKSNFKKWGLEKRLDNETQYFDSTSGNDFSKVKLVVLDDTTFTLADFIDWYKIREEYIKFDQGSFNSFSASLESQIWQMVRDKLLTRRAYARGLQNIEIVRQQSEWWEDKILYSVMRDKIANSVGLNIESPAQRPKIYNKEKDIINKINKALNQLRAKYKITINNKLLNKIVVQDEDNPHAIDVYVARKGGIFPHPAYPSIDFNWRAWH
jgi:hypothetical protein